MWLAARTSVDHTYPPGSDLALVTWTQRQDEHWFGARIPARIQSIETVSVTAEPGARATCSYRGDRESAVATADSDQTSASAARIERIVRQAAAVMP